MKRAEAVITMRRTEAIMHKRAVPRSDISAIRAQIGGAKKQIVSRRIGVTTLSGDAKSLIAYFGSVAKEAGIIGPWTLKYRTAGARRYGSNSAGYVLVGERPYTDDELRREGEALVKKIEAAKAAEERRRQRKLDKMNALARELGLPQVEA